MKWNKTVLCSFKLQNDVILSKKKLSFSLETAFFHLKPCYFTWTCVILVGIALFQLKLQYFTWNCGILAKIATITVFFHLKLHFFTWNGFMSVETVLDLLKLPYLIRNGVILLKPIEKTQIQMKQHRFKWNNIVSNEERSFQWKKTVSTK